MKIGSLNGLQIIANYVCYYNEMAAGNICYNYKVRKILRSGINVSNFEFRRSRSNITLIGNSTKNDPI